MMYCSKCFTQYWIILFSVCVLSTPNIYAIESSKTDNILLGMSTALSGPAADLGLDMLHGINAGFFRVNQQGGVNNRIVKIYAMDDGYEPDRTAPNMRHLIEKQNVLAVIGNVGTPTAIAAIPVVNESKTLLFAPFTGAGVLRKDPPDRYVINYRASYAQETSAMVDALINIAGLKPEEIAFFTQRDGYGEAGFNGGVTALKRHGLKNEYAVLHTRYDRNTVAVENSVADILLEKITPRAIIMVGAYKPCAKFIKMVKSLGVDTLFMNVSFVGSASLARELGGSVDNVIVTQVVPHPNNDSLEIIKQFKQDMEEFYPNESQSFGALEGYIASKMFIAALKTIKDRPNRENIIDALEALGKFDIGLGVTQHLNRSRHQASDMVWPTKLNDGVFEAFSWADIKKITLN